MKIIITVFLGLIATFSPAQTITHNDLGQTGAFTNEVNLTPTNVQTGVFKLLGSYSVDGPVYAEPLCVSVVILGIPRNLLIVVTLNDSIYAFNADSPGTTVWSNLAFATPYSSYPGGSNLYHATLGCLSTPAVDVANGYVWAVCDNNTPNWQLWQFNLVTGATVSTTTITGSVVGTGDQGGAEPDPTSGGNLLFFPKYEFQRTGLTLANGNVYIGFAASDDVRPWHGWLMAYNTTTLSQVGIWCSTPNTYGGGIWMSGGAPAVDGGGNIYASTGNDSSYDGVTDFENSVLKFSSTLTLIDWFTPSDHAGDDATDADVSSGRVLLIPGNHYAILSSKDFYVYVIDTACMGHLQGSSGCTLQAFQTINGSIGSESGAYGTAFANNVLYVPTTTTGGLYAYTWGGSSFTTSAVWSKTSTGFAYPGPSALSESCNVASNCILWFTSVTSSANTAQPGMLNAWNPATGANYGSWALGANLSKWAAPSVLNGKVYVATQGKVDVFGLNIPAAIGQIGQVSGHIQVGQ